MQSAIARTALLVLAAASFACPDTTRRPTQPDAGSPADLVGRACNVDAECGELRCDKLRHQCICLSDESCKSADPEAPVRYCNNYTGLCVEEISGCRNDGDCELTEYCDSSIRACRSKKTFCEPCAGDTECGGDGDNCLDEPALSMKFCGRACAGDADCPRGAKCQDKGGVLQCWPAPNPLTPSETVTCADFQGCTPDSLRTCNSNADCAALGDQRCDTGAGRCVAIVQACPFGTVCDPRNRICVAECVADADCGDANLRCVNRVCEPLSECSSDAQCASNKVCSIPAGKSAGQCVPFCQSNADCPLGQLCQRGADSRYRCVAGCTSNANCPMEQRCNATLGQCEGPLVGSTRVCQATTLCDTCQVCDATTSQCRSAKTSPDGGTAFPYCTSCSSATQCPGGTCVLMDVPNNLSYCARFCGSGQECPQGFVCRSISGGAQYACVPSDGQCSGKCP